MCRFGSLGSIDKVIPGIHISLENMPIAKISERSVKGYENARCQSIGERGIAAAPHIPAPIP